MFPRIVGIRKAATFVGILNLPSPTTADAAVVRRMLGVYGRNSGVIGVMDSIERAKIRKNNFFRTAGLRRIPDSFQNGAQRFLCRGVPYPTPPESSCTLRANVLMNLDAQKSETRKKDMFCFFRSAAAPHLSRICVGGGSLFYE